MRKIVMSMSVSLDGFVEGRVFLLRYQRTPVTLRE